MIPILSFVGNHNSGKTTILCAVVEELSNRGIQVGVIKHSSSHLNIPHTTDSDKLFHAGAKKVFAVSSEISISYERDPQERPLSELLAELSPGVDLVITEGYKQESFPKIEVIRAETGSQSLALDHTIAIVSDIHHETEVPVFSFEMAADIAEFIISWCQAPNFLI